LASCKKEDEDLQGINGKLDLLLKRLETLEKLISTILGSQELLNAISLLRMSGELYRDYSDLTSRIAKAQKHLEKNEVASDDVIKCILRVLVVQGPRNISEITRSIRKIKGKASRSRIAEKLRTLEKMSIIMVIKENKKERVYELS
jgi:hypothetical protein